MRRAIRLPRLAITLTSIALASIDAMGLLAARNTLAVLAGERPLTPVGPPGVDR